ncbi:universal stress protein [Ulvibacterium sp.]|uniref:universal stress protein n=1 Tax=Ulvibacterium sp. TaxID=2665914 RepID=UPI00260CAA33|nr:universal stress protein [Ulvibacterium sp.]
MKVSVPFDFSKEAVNALKLGKQLATNLGLNLKLIHSLGLEDYPYYKTEEADRLKEIVFANAKSEVNKALEEVSINPNDIEISIKDGRPAPLIISTSQEREVLFTVIGRKASKVPQQVGSTTRDIMRYATGSVLSTRKETNFDDIKNILFITDFDNTPITAVGNLRKIQEINNAKLKVLYVNTKDVWQSTHETMDQWKEFCKIHNLTDTELEIINDESMEKGVLYHMRNNPVDLVAIKIQRSYGKLDLFDSHLSAERIMDHTDIPVLTYAKDAYAR